MHVTGGIGLFNAIRARPGNGILKVKQLYTDSAVSLSTSIVNGKEVEIPNMGDVVGLRFKLDVTAGGTLVTAATIDNVINEIQIVDVKGDVIWSGIPGTELNELQYLTSEMGKKESLGSCTEDTQVSNQFLIAQNIKPEHLPARIRIKYNPYSSCAASGADECAVTCDVAVYYRDGAAPGTFRVKKTTVTMAAGSNSLVEKLPRGKTVAAIMVDYDETDLTDVELSRDGSEELKFELSDFIQYMECSRASAHITDKLLLPVTPFKVTDKTKMELNAATSDTLNMYVITVD